MKITPIKILWFLVIIAGFIFVVTILVTKNLELASEISAGQDTQYSQAAVNLDKQTIQVEIPQTEDLKAKGLGGRDGLLPNHGMLFAFSISDIWIFWMKDMKFPIDIIWFDENLKVVDWKSNVSPLTYPETFAPKVPAMYVLEVEAGFASKNSLKAGDVLKFI